MLWRGDVAAAHVVLQAVRAPQHCPRNQSGKFDEAESFCSFYPNFIKCGGASVCLHSPCGSVLKSFPNTNHTHRRSIEHAKKTIF